MPDEIIKQDKLVTFGEFKKAILGWGKKDGFQGKVEDAYGQIPRLVKILQNFDPTGISGAIDQLVGDQISEREQDNILRAIYVIAEKVFSDDASSDFELSEEKFKLLFYVYLKTGTNIFTSLNTHDSQSFLEVSQHRLIAIAQYLEKEGFIKFPSWVMGMKITHKGISIVEKTLLRKSILPSYVPENQIFVMRQRMELRLSLLEYIYKESEEDVFKLIRHEKVADDMSIDHLRLLNELLPYLAGEGWMRFRTNDSISITEEGVEKVRTFIE